jgi:hypothetical protein
VQFTNKDKLSEYSYFIWCPPFGFSLFIQLILILPYFFTEDRLAALKSNDKEQVTDSAKPEPTTEILFLCSYDGCGKTFVDAGALKKHANVHGERQYVCHYEGCGKVLCRASIWQ